MTHILQIPRRVGKTTAARIRAVFWQPDGSQSWVAPIKPTLSNNGRRETVRVWHDGIEWLAEHWTGYTTRHTSMCEAMQSLADEVVHG